MIDLTKPTDEESEEIIEKNKALLECFKVTLDTCEKIDDKAGIIMIIVPGHFNEGPKVVQPLGVKNKTDKDAIHHMRMMGLAEDFKNVEVNYDKPN